MTNLVNRIFNDEIFQIFIIMSNQITTRNGTKYCRQDVKAVQNFNLDHFFNSL